MTTLQTHIVLNTGHLDEDVSDMLQEMGEDTDASRHFGDWRDRVVRCGFGYGHWVKVPRPDETDPEDGLEARTAGMPVCLTDCMGHAHALGAAWILFDRDEPAVDQLRHHDW